MARTRAKQKNKKIRIGILALVVFTIYILVSVLFVSQDIAKKNELIAQTMAETQDTEILNEQITKVIEKGADKDYIIQMAREKLGLVFPGEIIYVDIGSK